MLCRRTPALVLAALALAACNSSGGGLVETLEDARVTLSSADDLAEALRAEGAEVEEAGEVITAVFSIPGQALRVNGEWVETYRFPDEAAATAEIPRLTQSLIHWVGPARLYQDGALLVLYAGTDALVPELLRRLLGAPVATMP